MMSQAPYYPLDASRSEIRLLEILSPDDTALIICRLTTVSLLECPPFAALSYVWGNPSITEDIELDGITVAVTINLASALRHVHRQWAEVWKEAWRSNAAEPLKLWADAICINQEDFDERSAQVQLMGSIYSQAQIVLSWLGSGNSEIRLALETLNFFYGEFERLSDEELFSLEWMEKHPQLCARDAEDQPTKNRTWAAITKFLALPYWFRVWIFQEISLSRESILLCDSYLLNFLKLCAVCKRLHELLLDLRVHGRMKPDFLSANIWRALLQYLNYTTINRYLWVKLLMMHQSKILPAQGWVIAKGGGRLLATNAKDHIYGLLGLTGIDIIPDYTNATTLGDVYCQYVKVWLDSQPTLVADLEAPENEELRESIGDMLKTPLDFLAHAGIGLHSDDRTLPSWVPNYAAMSQDTSGCAAIFKGNADNGVFETQPNNDSIVWDNSLFVTGLQIDTVVRKEVIPKPNELSNGTMAAYFQNFVTRKPIYVTGIPALQAIFRVAMRHRGDIKDIRSMLLVIGFLRIAFYNRRRFDPFEVFRHVGLGTGSAFYDSFGRIFCPGTDLSALRLPNPIPHQDSQINTGNLRFGVAQAIMSLTIRSHCYQFVETKSGYLGLAPQGTLVDDIICVLRGCPVPVVLRQVGSHFVFVGTSFVEGLMDGEASSISDYDCVRRFELR